MALVTEWERSVEGMRATDTGCRTGIAIALTCFLVGASTSISRPNMPHEHSLYLSTVGKLAFPLSLGVHSLPDATTVTSPSVAFTHTAHIAAPVQLPLQDIPLVASCTRSCRPHPLMVRPPARPLSLSLPPSSPSLPDVRHPLVAPRVHAPPAPFHTVSVRSTGAATAAARPPFTNSEAPLLPSSLPASRQSRYALCSPLGGHTTTATTAAAATMP